MRGGSDEGPLIACLTFGMRIAERRQLCLGRTLESQGPALHRDLIQIEDSGYFFAGGELIPWSRTFPILDPL